MTKPIAVPSPFDTFAWFYDRYWAAPFTDWQGPAIDRLLLAELHPGAHVLDLCCGTGTLARFLSSRGLRVTGVDSSQGMLRIARAHLPDATFVQADACNFEIPEPADAAVCVFDSVNHLLEPALLADTFSCVQRALRPNGIFVLDVNTDSAYGERWNDSFSQVADDHAFFLRGGYDDERCVGHTLVTMFRFNGGWERSDAEIRQRPWAIPEVERMLRDADFVAVRAFRSFEDLGMGGHYGIGRVYVSCSRKSRHLG